MKETEIADTLRGIISPYLRHTCEIVMESNLTKDLSINSVDLINVIMDIEEAFQCTFDDEQMYSMHNLKDLVQYVQNCNRTIQ